MVLDTKNKKSLLCGLAASLLMAGTAPLYAQQGSEPSERTRIELDAQPLQEALAAIGAQYKITVVAPGPLVRGKQAPHIAGVMGLEEALALALAGTNLVPQRSSTGAIIIREQSNAPRKAETRAPGAGQQAQPVVDVISVYGRVPGDTARDVPQRVTVFGAPSFEISLPNTVGDVLSLVPAATRQGSSQDMFADDFLFRGFSAEQSTNGLGFTRTDHPTDLVNIERIEILKGPNSVLYGQMEPGGTINIVTKQPLPEFEAEAQIEYGSFDSKRGSFDITGPLSDAVRARLTLAYQNNGSPIDFLKNRRFFIAPNIAVDLSEQTLLTIEGSYSANEWTALNGGTPLEGALLDNPNGSYDKAFNPAYKDGITERNSGSINARLVHGFADTLEVRASYTYTRNVADWTEYAPFGLGDDFRTLDRIIFAGRNTHRNDHQAIVDLSGEIETGGLTHRFVAGLDYREGDLYRPTLVYLIDPVDIFDPSYSPLDLETATLARDRNLIQNDKSTALFLQDRVSLTDRLHVMAGLRFIDSRQSQTFINNGTGTSAEDEIKQSDWTTQFGLVYDLTQALSLYANRSEAFVPQQGTTSGAKPLEAEQSTQYEAGLRLSLGGLEVNATGFIITKDNIAIEDPLDDAFEIAAGRARSRGAELSLSGYIQPNWYVLASYGYTDTEILHSDDPELVGNPFINIPKHTAAFQTMYELDRVDGLSFGGTLTYLGKRPGDDENSFSLPGYIRADVGIYYQLDAHMKINVLVQNLFNETYYSPGSFDGVIREPGRGVRANLTYRF
ncbi:TonB-dependent siderophore receptor [Paremcibacter congregatus]|uniref:TonB-dependent siderophore receptor n=1 Tax=Paremcibacter congregatus TaxID=2043170 RepID=UPI003A92950C